MTTLLLALILATAPGTVIELRATATWDDGTGFIGHATADARMVVINPIYAGRTFYSARGTLPGAKRTLLVRVGTEAWAWLRVQGIQTDRGTVLVNGQEVVVNGTNIR